MAGTLDERTPNGRTGCQTLARVFNSATNGAMDCSSWGISALVSFSFSGSDLGGRAPVVTLPSRRLVENVTQPVSCITHVM